MHTPTDTTLRQRKFFLVLPLLVLPFLTLAFWALGGGRGTPFALPAATGSSGLSLTLPDPQFRKVKAMDKLSLYEQARRGLSKPATAPEGEAPATAPEPHALATPDPLGHTAALPDGPAAESGLLPADPKEAEINQRLAQLSALAAGTTPDPSLRPLPAAAPSAQPESRFSEDVSRLEAMMQRMGSPAAPSPEMQQMEALLERILDIQHPERVRGQSQEPAPLPPPSTLLQGSDRQEAVTLLEPPPPYARVQPAEATGHAGTATGFHPLQPLQSPLVAGGNMVEAVIPTTQTLQPGALVRLRLLEDLQLEGGRIPRGSFVYGTCRLRGERLAIEISSVLSGKASLAVALSAYDLDGQEGLYLPGPHVQEAARQEAGRALQQNLQFPTLSPSLGGQATSAGIAAARDMLRRQTRQAKVTVKAGHRLLLRNR
ncbi:conjugative transposon protein TraM [Pontibacter sp. HSC-14F20]|uniref:conjugative transposon protein TraM n=1 Tax=Pontibacter sp. HSC-14F20 TaxID=2864136 RepID=UPI001C72AE3D|nr:conjugative transposon protein TraM [Pontibacter sp. HSC-14F20]MBX0335363.1 conjugative transposon protein TraM [Pontibacter sp. HSC-14F20]